MFGLVRMCQLVLPSMRERGHGRIVNLSSMGANFTLPGGGVYHATKYAVEAISDALRFEVKGFGVDVTVIQPGLIRSEFAASAAAGIDPGDGPYGAFNASVVQSTTEVYEKDRWPDSAVSQTTWQRRPSGRSPRARRRSALG